MTLRPEEQGILPAPEEVTTDSLKGMPPDAWNVVISFLASFPTGGVSFKGDYLPSLAMRERAAAVAEKALMLWHAENIDEVRAKLGNKAKGLNLNFSLEEFVERTRATLSTGALEQAEALAKAGMLPDALKPIESLMKSHMDALQRNARRMAREYARGAVLCWDVLQKFKADPTWVPSQFEMDELAATTNHDPEEWRGDES